MQSYGGDAKIIATIQELERVSAKISNAAAVLPRQLSLGLALAQPVAVAYFVASISGISSRLERLAANCQEASAAYFSTEAQIAARFASGLPEVLERHPWLAEFYRPALVGQALSLGLAIYAGGAASSFTGSAATRGVRYLADLSPQLLGPLFGQPHGASREAAANLLASTARTGLLTETPVLARPVTPLIMPQSPGVRGLAERLTATAELPNPTVRIERYGSATERTFVILIPGTQSLALSNSKNPLDMKSNLQSMATPGLAGSERAVRQAIAKAGITAKDSVVLVGHSQGGLVAANIASQQNAYRVSGLVTFGAPVAQAAASVSAPKLSVEHTNDIVPALSGKTNPMQANWATVQTEYKINPSDSSPLASHAMASYLKTAPEIDLHQAAGLSNIREQILSQISGPVNQVQHFEISRQP